MKIGDKIIVNDDIEIDPIYARHGTVFRAVRPREFEIKFADGVVENYGPHECRVISDKEWFKLQLRGANGQRQ